MALFMMRKEGSACLGWRFGVPVSKGDDIN